MMHSASFIVTVTFLPVIEPEDVIVAEVPLPSLQRHQAENLTKFHGILTAIYFQIPTDEHEHPTT